MPTPCPHYPEPAQRGAAALAHRLPRVWIGVPGARARTPSMRWLVLLLALAAGHAAFAADTLKVAIGQRGDWENAAPVLGQQAGFFRKHGVTLKLIPTRGAGESLQAMISGRVEVSLGVSTAGVLGAYALGAPVRAIASSTTGADDLFWYVRADSPVRSMQDAGGKTIAYSSDGSSTSLAARAFIRQFGVDAKPVATGGPEATYAKTMSGSVDIGWSAPPFGVKAWQEGRIRIVAHQSDLPAYRNQTVRLMVANTATAERRHDVLRRFLDAYRETLAWMYTDPAALRAYAKWAGISVAVAKDVRDQFYPRENLRLERLSGIEEAMADAVRLKFLPAPLTKEQHDELFSHYARVAQ